MRQIWTISKRELQSFFDSLMAYILIVAFLLVNGFFTWIWATDIFYHKQASLEYFFSFSATWTLIIFIPAITMRLLAEENKTGTIELMLTRPITDWQIVIGKFLATLILIAIALVLTIPYYITIANLGPVDHGTILTGYLGLILMSATYISIGIFASSITNNQIISFLVALFIVLMFQVIIPLLSGAIGGFAGDIINFLSLPVHMDAILRGVIDSRDLLFFFSVIFLGLILTEANLAKKRN